MRSAKNVAIVPHGQHLHVEPASIEFVDIQANMKYIQTLVVRNLSPVVKRVRCEPPKTAEFRLVTDNQVAIAPGLSITIDVAFLTRTPFHYVDSFIIAAEDFKYEVPLAAKAPCADIVFESLIDFGTVITQRTHQQQIKFQNEGLEPGSFELVAMPKHIKMTPQSGTLSPRGRSGDQLIVLVEFASERPCSIQEIVEVKMGGVCGLPGLPSTNKAIHMKGTCVDQSLHLMLDGHAVHSLDFGSMYHGQSKVMKVLIVNSGPTSCSFNAQVTEDTEGSDARGTLASSPAETVAKAEQPLTVSPFTGQVAAFGKTSLEFTFSPAVVAEETGCISTREPEKHATSFEYLAKVESEEFNNLHLRLTGRAVLPALKVSPDILQFGKCPVHQRQDIVLTLTNLAEQLPPDFFDFEIPRVPHMTISPMKGKLAPQQSVDVVVSYVPKALGKFNHDLVIKYCSGLYLHRVHCSGEAPILGDKKKPVKGLERTGRDFDPQHRIADSSSTALMPPRLGNVQSRNMQSLTKIMKSRDTKSTQALESLMSGIAEPTPYSLSPSAMQDHVTNRQKYNQHLKDTRRRRKAIEKYGSERPPPVDYFCEEDVDRGMVPGSGLKSPRYSIDEIPVEKLWLERALDDDSGARGVTGHKHVHDENRLIKKKFKAGPTTQAEVKECSAALENWQLALISVGPRILDFENIYVKSQVVKSFSVYNDLPSAILVSMQYEAPELNRSTPVSQVIPSAQAAGFDVMVCSAMPQSFQRQVIYTINGMHAFKLLVKAEITPVFLKMSRGDLNFRFSEDNLERTLTETVTLTNSGNSSARFSWHGGNASFAINPTQGVIRAGTSCTCEVVFSPPNSGGMMEASLNLKTEDGEDQFLRCVGQVPDASCVLQSRRLELGILAVGLPHERSVQIVNNGKSAAVFHVEGVPDGITISPMRGRVPLDGRADLDVHVLLDRQMQLETAVTLCIRGGKPLRLPISAQAMVPNIEMMEDEIEFGQLTLGAMASAPITLKNSSAVEGTLYVNLQPYPEFSLSLAEEKSEAKEEEGDYDANAIQTITLQQHQLGVGVVGDALAGGNPTGAKAGWMMAPGSFPAAAEDDDEEANSQIYKITVQPHYTLHMHLSYQPANLGQHFFEFPILAAGGVKHDGLRKAVRAEALRPRMLFSDTTLDFKTKVVPTGVQSVPSVLELALHNADDYPIEWKIDTEPLKKHMGVFTLEPTRAVLEPEQDCLVRAAFMPNEPIEYKATLSVYISPPRTDSAEAATTTARMPLPPDESKLYLPIRLKGQGAVPKLTFDRKEVNLPVVPCGIRSRCLFYIINEGYESLEVQYRLPTDKIRIALLINFPEGQQVGITKPRIPVEIIFHSEKPISFSADIEFLDTETGSYTLPLSGTADNCVLSTHQYLQQNESFYALEGDPVMLAEKDDTAGGEVGAAPSVKTGSVSHQSLAGYGGQELSQTDFLVRWMNGNVLKNPLEHFPMDLISSGGRHLYEMIEFLSGKQVPQKGGVGAGSRADNMQSLRGDRSAKQKNKELVRIQGMCQQYEQLLTFLKQHGALLSSIRPEHFLSHEQFLRYMQSETPGITRRQVEKMFFVKSMEAWFTGILQTIKIFLLFRVTPKSFKALPGMTEIADQPISGPVSEDGMPDPGEPRKICSELQAAWDAKGLADSNVYSAAECILLRWLNFHFWRTNRERYPDRKITGFDHDLDDSIVLSVVIESHIPTCQAVLSMTYPCTLFDHYEENASRIVAALQEIGLAFPIQAADITAAQPKDMLLFVLFLFQNLPHYVPKTVIVFSTLLGVSMTKNIELTNPSRKAITYNIQLQGSSDFSIKEESVKIESRQTITFPVEFQSRFTRRVEGQIVFTSRREGNLHAAAMVFKLRSHCIGKQPRKTIPVSAVLYEIGTVVVDVDNPFDEDASFTVNIREESVCDAEKKPIKSKRCESVATFHIGSQLGPQTVKAKAKGTGKLTVSFLPFDAPAHFVALLGFFDPNAGEFYYELFGESSPPLPLEIYRLQVKAEELGTKELILPHRNVQMDRARMWIEQRGAGSKQSLPDTIVYNVKLSSQYYLAPKQVTVVNAMAKNTAADAKADSKQKPTAELVASRQPTVSTHNVAKLSLEFRPKEPGVYPCQVILTSDVDIRMYQIEGTGTAPNTHCALTFHTQARKHVTQEIPILNPTDREWTIKPTFSQQGTEFDGPREFIAKKRQGNGQASMSYYPLTFKPEWVRDTQAQLVLQNTGTNETYEYELHGIADEPLAEEHVVIKCEAREKTSHTFRVRNYATTAATFEVESDLVHISGPSSVQVGGRATENYVLVFQPLQAGQVTGCIMFRDCTTGHFTWYTVELMTLPPKPQQTLTLTCVVRQAVAVDIQLVNPLDDVVVFEVALNGDGLLGEAEFFLAPNETATYELVFSPLLPSRSKGTAVFFNDVVGEFWYDLELIAEPAQPEALPPMECELGRTLQTTVKIDNPTGQEVVLKHRSTNKVNFRVLQQRIPLPPLESTTVAIDYSPSSLGLTEEAQITFEHPTVGQWVYKLQGVGLPPIEARQVTIVAQVNRPVSSTITFKNPFLEAIHASAVLESRSDRGVFLLLNKKAKVQIMPLATTQIPFSFCPPSMTRHSAELIVSVAKPNLTWTYQIQGVAEAPADSTVHTFTVQAREVLETYHSLNLIGLDTSPADQDSDTLSCQLEVQPQHQALVSKCFDISLGTDPNATSSRTDKAQVSLKVNFAPLRPFVAMCKLVITRSSGGRWRFDLKLEATEPEVDDTISIQSPLNKPASVAFRLSNHTSVYSEFQAFFDAESAYEFTVQPTSGVLEPAGTGGTTFVVTYKPTEYGKPVQGKLIIQTDDVYWSYAVRGTHPKYSAPVAEKAKVATRLSKDMQQELAKATSQRRKKNFIQKNMAGSSVMGS